MTFHTENPSEYPDSWDRWPVDGEGDAYCGCCGCDQPDDPESHSMYCEFSDEYPEPGYDDVVWAIDYQDTIAEQTDPDR